MTAPETTQTRVDRLEAHLGRADTKASILLALTGAGVVGAAGPVAALPTPAAAVGWTAIGALVAAAVILTLAVRPDLRGDWGINGDAAPAGTELTGLRRLARTKYVRIRWGTDLILAAVALAAVTAVTARVA